MFSFVVEESSAGFLFAASSWPASDFAEQNFSCLANSNLRKRVLMASERALRLLGPNEHFYAHYQHKGQFNLAMDLHITTDEHTWQSKDMLPQWICGAAENACAKHSKLFWADIVTVNADASPLYQWELPVKSRSPFKFMHVKQRDVEGDTLIPKLAVDPIPHIGPMLTLVLVEDDNCGFRLILVWPHSLMDGRSAVMFANTLLEGLDSITNRHALHIESNPPLPPSDIEVINQYLASHPQERVSRPLPHASPTDLFVPFDTLNVPIPSRKQGYYVTTWASNTVDVTSMLLKQCRKHDVTVYAAVVAAHVISQRGRVKGDESLNLCVFTPVEFKGISTDTRMKDTAGNYFGDTYHQTQSDRDHCSYEDAMRCDMMCCHVF